MESNVPLVVGKWKALNDCFKAELVLAVLKAADVEAKLLSSLKAHSKPWLSISGLSISDRIF